MNLFQNLVENIELNTQVWQVWVTLITWLFTVFFAAKSFFLERKIWKLNIFHWEGHITRMETYPLQKKYLRIMFTNISNVAWYVNNIAIEIEPRSYWWRIRAKIKTANIWRKLGIEPESSVYIVPLRSTFKKDELSWVENQYPPYKIFPQESNSIFIEYHDFCKQMSRDLKKYDARVKQFVFFTSNNVNFYAKFLQKTFPDLTFSEELKEDK